MHQFFVYGNYFAADISKIPVANLLLTVSSKSCARLLPLVGTVARPCPGLNRHNNAQTFCSRQKQWLEFCAIYFITYPVMRHLGQCEHNLIVACYTVYLSNSCMINGYTVKTSTIKEYLQAMARSSTNARIIDPSKIANGA